MDAGAEAVPGELFPVSWQGRQAVVTLPEDIDAANTGQLRDELLGLVNRGPEVLIADLTGTVSCDHGGAEALARAYHRASVNGTLLKIAASSPHVRQILTVNGLDRLVSVYPSLEAGPGGPAAANRSCRQVRPRGRQAARCPADPPGRTVDPDRRAGRRDRPGGRRRDAGAG